MAKLFCKWKHNSCSVFLLYWRKIPACQEIYINNFFLYLHVIFDCAQVIFYFLLTYVESGTLPK